MLFMMWMIIIFWDFLFIYLMYWLWYILINILLFNIQKICRWLKIILWFFKCLTISCYFLLIFLLTNDLFLWKGFILFLCNVAIFHMIMSFWEGVAFAMIFYYLLSFRLSHANIFHQLIQHILSANVDTLTFQQTLILF